MNDAASNNLLDNMSERVKRILAASPGTKVAVGNSNVPPSERSSEVVSQASNSIVDNNTNPKELKVNPEWESAEWEIEFRGLEQVHFGLPLNNIECNTVKLNIDEEPNPPGPSAAT